LNEYNKIYHGDCLDIMDKLIDAGIKVDAIITDIPYGTTNCAWDSVIPFDNMWKRLKTLRKENTPIALFGSEPFSSQLRLSNIKEYKYDWYWRKSKANGFLNAKKMPLKDIETISVFYNKLPLYNPQDIIICTKEIINNKAKMDNSNHISGQNGGAIKSKNYIQESTNYPRQILDFPSVSRPHLGVQKPIQLMEYLINTYTKENDLVLDFTCGSGTTLCACIKNSRKYIGIEKNEQIYNIAIDRISGYIHLN